MATQAAMIMDTIVGMKRILTQPADCMSTLFLRAGIVANCVARSASDSDEPYLQPPNRGNKLKRKAHYAPDGRPLKKKGRETYTKVSFRSGLLKREMKLLKCRQNIEHAGYRRDILRRNPKRYDEDGDELDPDDEDEEADARAAEENPYADIHLESKC